MPAEPHIGRWASRLTNSPKNLDHNAFQWSPSILTWNSVCVLTAAPSVIISCIPVILSGVFYRNISFILVFVFCNLYQLNFRHQSSRWEESSETHLLACAVAWTTMSLKACQNQVPLCLIKCSVWNDLAQTGFCSFQSTRAADLVKT